MSFEYIHKIPAVEEILEELPLSDELKKIKAQRDREAIDIFTGASQKFMLIIGPCSADNEDAVVEYVNRLAKLNAEVQDVLMLVPRIYTNKPRTTGEGYKGMAHQPNPQGAPNIVEGLKAIRRMHIRSLQETHLSAADEMLYPGNYPYLEDLLSYVAIGARSVENQQHRLTVSGLDIPIGLKNPTSGDLNVLLNSIQAAQAAHTFIYNGWEVKTGGNPYAHAILRGAFTQYGRNIPNFHYEDLMRVTDMYHKKGFANPAVIVDVSHANCGKVFSEQPRVAMEVLQNMAQTEALRSIVKGLMIESYLEEGTQPVDGGVYGKSITDPCMG
ncbi:MAG: 3-deoxy-7-phosphoheptulonate synthase, partial [Candidatus Omnitrophica bacterium]|nr:3-deoxy-7-phosphoheptulonate synthase [Candidatus Omnitrophota bacterium]